MRRVTATLLLLAVLAAPAGALAAAPRATLGDIEDEVMCVSCNVVLNVAESPQADATRMEIRRLIARGETKQQIKDQLVAQYGPRVLALPSRSGFNLTVYLVPILVALALIAAAVLLVRRWSRRRPGGDGPAAPDGPSISDADARRLDADLARYEP